MPPGRSGTGCGPETSTTVLSMPTLHGPPSSTSTSAEPNDSSTCRAVVGDTSFERLALGAATGTCAARSNVKASGCAGTRTPTFASPATTLEGTSAAFSSTIVSGPGQKRVANSSAYAGHAATSATCTITGLCAGRPLAA